MKIETIKCPNCGAPVTVSQGQVKVVCEYCGSEIVPSASEHQGQVAPIQNWLELASTALDGENWDEVITYCNLVLEKDPTNSLAWWMKGTATAWQSTLAHPRFEAMFAAFNRAVDCADEDTKQEMKELISNTAVRFFLAFYKLAQEHMTRFAELDSARDDFVLHALLTVNFVDKLLDMDPENMSTAPSLAAMGEAIAKQMLEGIPYVDSYGVPRVEHLTRQAAQLWRRKFDRYVSILQRADPSYRPPTIRKKKDCFIATAATGDPTDSCVVSLQQFRDENLATTKLGQTLIGLYDWIGPPLASIIAKSAHLRKLTLWLIVKPSAYLVNGLRHLYPPRSPDA